MGNCKDCAEKREEKKPETIPYIVFEYEMDRATQDHKDEIERSEKHAKRWMITCFVLIGIIVSMIVSFLIYERQFETYYYEQDGEGVNIIGDENEVNPSGPNTHSKEAEATTGN